ncbi:hypothetical protein IV73_GL000771 [Weissella kandleri]|uniref:Uncharacterized protein n=1 Tax=Weissella kandleri TaxID=1616 RepID=A0A0R2JGM1_9LACO|nr:hypothetical protein [Weissella kandleri]KRN75014.1 hypothetical protein IV73_GL000771 [Weissella kandleri]
MGLQSKRQDAITQSLNNFIELPKNDQNHPADSAKFFGKKSNTDEQPFPDEG